MGGFNFGAIANAFKNKQNGTTGSNTVQGTVVPSANTVQTPAPSVSSAPSYSTSGGGSSAPAYNAQQLKAINDVTYLKQQYDAAQQAGKKDSAAYLAKQAQGIYKGLDPALASQLQGMNAQQASSFYAGAKNGGTANTTSTGAPIPVNAVSEESSPSQLEQMWAEYNKILQQQAQASQAGLLQQQQMYQQQIDAARGQYQGLIGQAETDRGNDLLALQNRYSQSKDELGDQTFQQWLEARQNTADRGLAGSGLASDADTRLLMANNKTLGNLQNTLLQEENATKSRYDGLINNYKSQVAALPSVSSGGVATRTDDSANVASRSVPGVTEVQGTVVDNPTQEAAATISALATGTAPAAASAAPTGYTSLDARSATSALAQALNAGGASLPSFYSGLSGGSGGSSSGAGGFDSAGSYLAGIKEFLPYFEATVKDKMSYDIDSQDQARQWAESRGYFDDGSLTLNAQDKAAKNQMDLAKILGYFNDGTQTLDARNSAANQQLDLAKILGAFSDGTLTLDGKKAQAQNELDWTKLFGTDANGNLTLDAKTAQDTSAQNWTKIEQNAAQWEQEFALNTFKTNATLELDREKVKISQQNANTQFEKLQQQRLEWDDKEERADANAQAGAAKSLMTAAQKDADAAYKKMQAHLNTKDAKGKPGKTTDAAYISAQEQYTKARKQYELAFNSIDELYQVSINKALTPKQMTAEMKKIMTQAKKDYSAAGVLESVANGTWGGQTSGKLGSLSAKYESRGNAGTIARTKGDSGGASYGTYQFTTNQGSAKSFVNSLSKTAPAFAKLFSGKSPGTSAFDAAWKQAAKDPQFETLQYNYAVQSFYQPAVKKLKNNFSLDVTKRSQAVQDAVWSTAIQHGLGGMNSVFKNAGISAAMTDKEILNRLYKERGAGNGSKYFGKNSKDVQVSVANRFKNELSDALKMLG